MDPGAWLDELLTGWPPEWPVVAAAAVAVVDVLLRVVALVIVPAGRRPSSAVAWLLAIFLIPYLGALAFLLIGYPRLPRARRQKQRRVDELIEEASAGSAEVDPDATTPRWLASVARMNRRLGAMPLLGGNAATLHADYGDSLAAMVRDVDGARRSVHAEFYLLSLDPATTAFVDALGRAVQRGVVVRVLVDHLAALRAPGHRATARRLDELGVDWRWMLPLQPLRGKLQRPDLRNHRKLLVVDGEVGWSGSQNVVDASYGKRANVRRGLQWVDLMARFTGPVVAELDAVFATDWYSETDVLLGIEERTPLAHHHPDADDTDLDCQVVPSGPGFPVENNLRLFTSMLHSAQREVLVTSPYFVPEESLLGAVTTAAQRGLSVELFVSEIGDQWLVHHAQRSYYDELLRAGVRIWLYPAPFVLHAKHVSVDGEVAAIGSSNMDVRSFNLNLEVTVLVRGAAFVEGLRRVQDGYRARSRELLLTEWEARPRWQKVLDNAARLTSALQ